MNIEKYIEQATINGKLNQEKFAELIVGKCIATVLSLEMSKSDFIASVIEEKIGFEQGHFSDEWFDANQKVFSK